MTLRSYRTFATELLKIAAKKTDETTYDKVKSVVVPAAAGVAATSGLTRLGQRLYGQELTRPIEAKHFRIAAPIGAALGVADALYQRHREKKAEAGLGTFTPARRLQAASEVRKRDKTVFQAPGQIGVK